MNVIFSYTVDVTEESYQRQFKFTLHAEFEGLRTVHYEASHAFRDEACRQALELFAMRASPMEAMVSYDDKIDGCRRFTGGPPNFIVDHLPNDAIKHTILQIIEIWKKDKNHDQLLTEPRAAAHH